MYHFSGSDHVFGYRRGASLVATRNLDAAPLGDLAVLDAERGGGLVAGAFAAAAGAGALAEAEGGDDELAVALGLDDCGAAGQAAVEADGVGAVAELDRLGHVLDGAGEREVAGGLVDVPLGKRGGPVLDDLDRLGVGLGRDDLALDRERRIIVSAATAPDREGGYGRCEGDLRRWRNPA
jgi:hypothetical protein